MNPITFEAFKVHARGQGFDPETPEIDHAVAIVTYRSSRFALAICDGRRARQSNLARFLRVSGRGRVLTGDSFTRIRVCIRRIAAASLSL